MTWHVHGSYLYYLSQAPHDFHVPVKPARPEGYGGRPEGGIRWPDNLHEVQADEVRALPLDCVVFNSRRNYVDDQYEILSPAQRRLPRIFLEHDPPREHPTDTRHPVDDPDVLLIHVTPFNELMWDNGAVPTRVIEHGVSVPDGVVHTGEIARGLAVVNGLDARGRRLGLDVYERARREVPIDLVGIGSERIGGLGEIDHAELPAFMARYRFFFNPIRYTSLGLAVCEAMMIGMPIVGLATTEMVTAVTNGRSGYLDTRVEALVPPMRRLLDDPAHAAALGQEARRQAQRRFALQRFVGDWNDAFQQVTGTATAAAQRQAENAAQAPVDTGAMRS